MTKFVEKNQGLGDPAAYLELIDYWNPEILKLGIAKFSKSADYGRPRVSFHIEKMNNYPLSSKLWTLRKQGVCHTMALRFTLKKYLKPKEELWKFKYFTMQKYNLTKKIPWKETKTLQDIRTL
jgi:hypothetical protein